MAVNWGLVAGQNFDPFGAGVRGYQTGQQFAKDRERRSILAEIAGVGGPVDYQQASRRLLAVDPQAAATFSNLGLAQEDRAFRRETRAEDVAHRNRTFDATRDYQNRSLGIQGANLNKPPELIRTLQAMGINPQSPEARNYLKQPGAANLDKPSDLRKEIRSLPSYKAAATVVPLHNNMVKAVKRDTRAADVSMVFSFMKMLDPTSVVRESEVDMANNIATLPQKYQAQVQSFLSGKGRLTPEVRQSILTEARGMTDQFVSAWERDKAQYLGITQRSGLSEQDVIPSFDPLGPAPQGGGTDGAGGGGFRIIGVE